MIQGLQNWLNQIPLHDEVERQQARLLQNLLLGFIALLVISMGLLPFVEAEPAIKMQNVINNSIAAGILTVIVILIRRGRFHIAVGFLIVLILLGMLTSVRIAGITAGNIALFMIPLVLSGLVLGRRYLIITTALIAGIVIVGAWTPASGFADSERIGVAISLIMIVSLLAVFLDSVGTTLKRALADANRTNEQLEMLVEARTAELAAKNIELERLARVKDEFVANVSHELRTPITSLKIQYGLMKQDPSRVLNRIEILNRETDRLANIIEVLLQLSRLDRDFADVNLEPVELYPLVLALVQDRTSLAAIKNQTLTVGGEKNTPPVIGDQDLLTQAISILLTNALAYTPPEGLITVKTAARPVNEMSYGHQWAGVSVIDNGPGIPIDEQVHLFERFFRGKIARQSGVQGTGLGLALLKEIVTRQEGQIDVFSTGVPGQGTRFDVWLPVWDR